MIERARRRLFRTLFPLDELIHYLSVNRNYLDAVHGSISDDEKTPTAYEMLINALSDKDIAELDNHNARMVMTYSPASCFHMPSSEGKVHVLCFDRHTFDKFPKEHLVALILHEMGHVFNPNFSGMELEFKADDYAINRGFGLHLASCLKRGVEIGLVDFDDDLNPRIERLKRLSV